MSSVSLMNQPGAVTVGLASMLRAPSLQPSEAAKLREASKIRTRSRVKGLVICAFDAKALVSGELAPILLRRGSALALSA